VAFGFEGAPGHQTSGDRGFSTSADAGGTYGGVGWYTANIGGLWDALLAEGRNWWNFASSDFHNHWSTGGSDFWPGEYQKDYAYLNTENEHDLVAVVEGLRSGNSYFVEGDLIDDLQFIAKSGGKRATMGQTLNVEQGDQVVIKIKVNDPEGPNYCPLNMDNPSLAQIGVSQPLNMPVLDHVDLIAGEVTGLVSPDEDDYAVDVNESTAVVATFMADEDDDALTFVYKFKAKESMYFRLRGTNLPAGVPYETDAEGNPLADSEAEENLYDMDGDALADYLFEDITEYVIDRKLDSATYSKLDEVLEAYADLWFYSNPIYVNVIEGKKKDK
jgi:hypothetical protein